MPVAGIESASAEQLTRQPAGIGTWQWTNDSRRIYFAADDVLDKDEKARREKKFTVNIRNMETPRASLWALDLDPVKPTQLTNDSTYSVSDFSISDDGKWVGYRGASADRYKRNITQQGLYADLYLLETASGQIERLTKNEEVGESAVSFSPDGKLIAFSAPDDMEKVQHVERAALHSRGRCAREAVPQARRFVRWRRHRRFLVQGRHHHLLQRGGPRHQSADGARHQAEHRQAAHQREGVAPGQSARQFRRPDRRVLRRHDAIDDVHGRPASISSASGRRGRSSPTTIRRCAASRWASRKRSPGNPRTVRPWAVCSSSRSATGPGNDIR